MIKIRMMRPVRYSVWVSAVLLALLMFMVSGCDQAGSDWERVKANNTTTAYQDFLSRHADSTFVEEARRRLIEIDWTEASKTNTPLAYEAFLQKHPASRRTAEAEARLQQLVWSSAVQADTVEAFETFTQRWPNSERGDQIAERVQSLKILAEAARIIELSFLEWVTFGSGQLTRNATVSNQGLLKQSALWSGNMMVMKVGNVDWRRMETGIGLRFGTAWDSPYVIAGDDHATVEFRRGSVSLADGRVQYSSGLQALIHGTAKVSNDGGVAIFSSDVGDKLIYTFLNGKWSSGS